MKRKGPIKCKAKAKTRTSIEQFHVERVAQLPCCVSGQRPVVIHHLLHVPGKRCRRDDRFIVPLTPALHNMGTQSVHLLGSEKLFQDIHGINLVAIGRQLWEETVALVDPDAGEVDHQ